MYALTKHQNKHLNSTQLFHGAEECRTAIFKRKALPGMVHTLPVENDRSPRLESHVKVLQSTPTALENLVGNWKRACVVPRRWVYQCSSNTLQSNNSVMATMFWNCCSQGQTLNSFLKIGKVIVESSMTQGIEGRTINGPQNPVCLDAKVVCREINTDLLHCDRSPFEELHPQRS